MANVGALIVSNLEVAAVGYIIFILAYVSNMTFSIYYNTHIEGQNFCWDKIILSVVKVISFAVGAGSLILSISLIIPWASSNGLEIPVEYEEVISIVSTLGVTLVAALKYILEAFTKMRQILFHVEPTVIIETRSKRKKK